jgi:hypothetical protein
VLVYDRTAGALVAAGYFLCASRPLAAAGFADWIAVDDPAPVATTGAAPEVRAS